MGQHLIDSLADHMLTHQAPYLTMAQPTLEDEDTTTQQQSPRARSAEWLETFLLHFDNLRETPNVDATFDAVYNEQQQSVEPRDTSPLLPQSTASHEPSPVYVLPIRESTPVFRLNRSRDGTPVLSASRESTPATTTATYSRESTPVLSLNMDDPVQAATALAWLEAALLQVDSGLDAERLKKYVVLPLAMDPAKDRGVLLSCVGAKDF